MAGGGRCFVEFNAGFDETLQVPMSGRIYES